MAVRLALVAGLSVWVAARAQDRSHGPAAAPAHAEAENSPDSACDVSPPPPVELEAGPSFAAFIQLLAGEMDRAETPAALQREFEAFCAAHDLDPSAAALWRDYRRLRLLFEAVRDAGFWRIRWDITNQKPSSSRIWQGWARTLAGDAFEGPSATAECDELSALYAFLAGRLGVRRVGLFYPTWNHTIAAWSPTLAGKPQPFRVLIPTSQIFLACDAGFDRTTFSAKRRVSYEYAQRDLRDTAKLETRTAEFLLGQLRVYAGASPGLLALLRAHRAQGLRSSMGECVEYRRSLATAAAKNMTCADRRALRFYFATELKSDDTGVALSLARLAD